MNWADYTILAVLGLSVLMGLWRGFIGEGLALICWVLAFWAAWMFGPPLAEHFSASISTPSVRVLLAYVLCFVTVLIDTSQTRETDRIEAPSTRRLRIWTRVSRGSLFMPLICELLA